MDNQWEGRQEVGLLKTYLDTSTMEPSHLRDRLDSSGPLNLDEDDLEWANELKARCEKVNLSS